MYNFIKPEWSLTYDLIVKSWWMNLTSNGFNRIPIATLRSLRYDCKIALKRCNMANFTYMYYKERVSMVKEDGMESYEALNH